MKISVILPYFGVLPNYFQLWLNSAGYNPEYTFLLFLDNPITYHLPENVKVYSMTFRQMQERIYNTLGKHCVIKTPYKLCDYKPAYGLLFSDFLEDSDWWGYCDPDIIWGNLAAFLTPELFKKYNKILTLGHLTLYHNDYENNHAFQKVVNMPYTAFEAYHIEKIAAFDETSCVCLSEQGIYRTYDNRNAILDIWPHKFKFRTFLMPEEDRNYFIAEYDHGHIYAISEGNSYRQEFMYIHLQKRKLTIKIEMNCEHYLIVPNALEYFQDDKLSDQYINFVNSQQLINYAPGDKTRKYRTVADIFIELKRLMRKLRYMAL